MVHCDCDRGGGRAREARRKREGGQIDGQRERERMCVWKTWFSMKEEGNDVI